MSVVQWWLFEVTPIIAVIFDLVIFYKAVTILYYKSLQ